MALDPKKMKVGMLNKKTYVIIIVIGIIILVSIQKVPNQNRVIMWRTENILVLKVIMGNIPYNLEFIKLKSKNSSSMFI